ncbi:MAG TPA: choice-of-anchor D domain-containing protein [Terriglobia bacterium]
MKNRKQTTSSAIFSALVPILVGAWGAPASRAAGPAVSLSPNTLNFPSQLATTVSAPQTATLTNTGNQPLTISSIAAVGTFAQTNNCPTSLAAGAPCTITVTFTPLTGASGEVPGLIIITDNALPGPQVISLGGLAANFSLAVSPSSNTISAGQSATYTITVTPGGGFSQSVSLSCGALPAGASCGFSPASVTPSGSSSVTSMLTISTTAGSRAGPRPWLPPARPGPLNLRIWGWLFLASAGALALRRRSGVARAALAVVALLAALAAPACGGGGSSSSSGSVATPAGTYTVLVTGSTAAGSSTVQNPVSLMLVVD